MGGSLRDRLKASTRREHERLEARTRLGEPLDREVYATVLGAMRGFYAPVEAALRAVRTRAVPLPLDDRTSWLDEDLRALGRSGRDLPVCQALPPLSDASDGFGCAYVLEGASLGGVVIERQLRERHPGARRFFTGHGPNTGARWKAFLASLEEAAAREPLDADRVVEAARATFERLEDWLAHRGALR